MAVMDLYDTEEMGRQARTQTVVVCGRTVLISQSDKPVRVTAVDAYHLFKPVDPTCQACNNKAACSAQVNSGGKKKDEKKGIVPDAETPLTAEIPPGVIDPELIYDEKEQDMSDAKAVGFCSIAKRQATLFEAKQLRDPNESPCSGFADCAECFNSDAPWKVSADVDPCARNHTGMSVDCV